MFDIVYHSQVVEYDIPKLASSWRQKIRTTIEQRLSTDPAFYGKPLRRSLKGYRKLRIGDYRVIFTVEGQTVKILMIAHRSIVYTVITKRI